MIKFIITLIGILFSTNLYCQNDTINLIFHRSVLLRSYESGNHLTVSDEYLRCRAQYTTCSFFEELPSVGFEPYIKFYLYHVDEYTPVDCYDTIYHAIAFSVTYSDVPIIIVAFNTKTNMIYKISGFDDCDFLKMVFGEIDGLSYAYEGINYYSLIAIKSKSAFLKQYKIDKIDMELLFDISLGLYKNWKNIKKLKFTLHKGRRPSCMPHSQNDFYRNNK